eukprot:3747922-Pyramimonas_sp.AAC.1
MREEDGGEVQVLRHAGQVRPLGLNNVPNKILTSVCCRSLTRQLPRLAHQGQRGFIPSRNFGENALELDTMRRIISTWGDTARWPPRASGLRFWASLPARQSRSDFQSIRRSRTSRPASAE